MAAKTVRSILKNISMTEVSELLKAIQAELVAARERDAEILFRLDYLETMLCRLGGAGVRPTREREVT